MKQNSPLARAEIRRSKPRSLTLFKSAKSLPALITSLLLALGLCCQAQSWKTVDDFQPNTNNGTYGDVIAAGGPSNLVFATGYFAGPTGFIAAVVRRSLDQGKNWETVDESTTWSSEMLQIKAAAVSPTGLVLFTGLIRPNFNSLGRWLVRLSNDGGTTWVTVEDFVYQIGSSSNPFAVDIAPDGTIYVTGSVSTDQSPHLLIRRSIDQGVSWDTVVDEPWESYGLGGISSAKLTREGMFLLGGYYSAPDAQGNRWPAWKVVRSTDQMASWQVVDDWLLPGSACHAVSLAQESNGNLVVIGRRGEDWVTRRSADGGNTWALVDAVTNQFGPYGVAADSSGRLWATGTSCEYRTRVSYDGGATWADSDRFVYDVAACSRPAGITSDGAGNIFVIGTGYVSEQKSHWVVRKLAAVGPALSAARSGSGLKLSWPSSATGFVLQSATTLTNGVDWQDAPNAPTEINGQKVVTMTPTEPRGFFRLRGP